LYNLLEKLIFLISFIKISWLSEIKRVIKEFDPDIVHVHDIWLARTIIIANTNTKLVIDLHENMPAAVVEYRKSIQAGFKYLIEQYLHSHTRIIRYERAILTKYYLVLVVVEEARNRVLAQYPFTRSKVFTVENLESKQFIKAELNDNRKYYSEGFNLLYIGGFGSHRGIDTLVESMVHIKHWGLNINIYLVGARKSNPYTNYIIKLVEKCDVNEYVRIIDWISSDDVLSYIKQASVGVVPHKSNPHTDNTIPHKLYQYMISSIPVLVSNCPPLARVVEKSKSGLVFKADDSLDLAKKIRKLHNMKDNISDLGSNGYNYVMMEKHNWEEESAPKLIESYNW